MTEPRPEAAGPSLELTTTALSRRAMLRAGLLTGGGLIAAAAAACAPTTAAPTWTYPPTQPVAAGGVPPSVAPSASADDHASHAPSTAPAPSAAPGAPVDHDAIALAVVKRFLDGEGGKLDGPGNQLLAPTRVENG